MFRYKTLAAPLVVATFALSGCQTGGTGTSPINTQTVGAAVGAVGGGLIGTQIGKGRGRTAAIIGGTILGGVLGSAVAARLSPQGQEVAYNTTQQAMDTAPVNQPVRWSDPVNPQIYGTVTPTTAPYYVEVSPDGYLGPVQTQQPQYTQPQYAQPQYAQPQYTQPQYNQYGQPQAVATSSGVECRDYQTAVFSGGQPETLTGRMCRRGPGQPWRPANDGYLGV